MKFVFYAYNYCILNSGKHFKKLHGTAVGSAYCYNAKQALATYTWTNNIVQKTDTYMYQKFPGQVIIQPVLAQG